jgi:hypothetical protein
MPSEIDNCATCRYHRAEMQPKVLDAAFDTVVAFADKDEKVYFCTSSNSPHAGKKVGPLPVLCEGWSAPRPVSELSELDRLMARAAERASKERDR